MDGAEWERAQAVFHRALEMSEGERAAYVAGACEGEVRAAVLGMLEEDGRKDSVLDGELGGLAAGVLGGGVPELGPYRVREVLGEGGMGIVYLAEREDLGSLVAVKLLRDAWMSPARRRSFQREQRVLGRLTHKGIARIYDADTTADGTPWFAMEYVKGVPLAEYCSARGSSIEERLRLVRGVCEAVQSAHSLAVIHCDLKPTNILVEADGTVKLLDFGIARRLDPEETEGGTAVRWMTPRYAAPEQMRGELAGVYTDVYALGVILRELVEAGPAAGRGERADLEAIWKRAAAAEPGDRYASVEGLMRDVDHFLAGEPVEARPKRWMYRAGKFLRRNGRMVGAGAVAAGLLGGLIVYSAARVEEARRAAVAEAARAQRVLRFTVNLFQGGDKGAGPARDLRVTTLLERGEAETAGLGGDREVQGEVYGTLGEVYQKLGEFERADGLLSKALERGERAGEVRVKLGLLRLDQAKLEEAEKLVREGLEMARVQLRAGDPRIGAAMHALGRVLEERGKYKEAVEVLTEASKVRGGDGLALGETLLELANVHFYAGNLTEAEAVNRRLLEMHGRMVGERHPLIAEELVNLGAIAQERGKYAEAEAFHRKALGIVEEFYGKEHYRTGMGLTLVARAVVKQNRPEEAIGLLREALRVHEKAGGPEHPRVASAVNELGVAALLQERYDEAEANFRRMAAIYRKVHNGKHYLIGIADANIGSVYMARKEHAKAEGYFRAALAMYGRTLPAGNMNFAITQIKLGRVLLRQGRFREAEGESLAGYRILSAQASPSVTWLQQAKKDLAAEYEAMGLPEKAKEFAGR
jgi:serine/threonine-protein kinase